MSTQDEMKIEQLTEELQKEKNRASGWQKNAEAIALQQHEREITFMKDKQSAIKVRDDIIESKNKDIRSLIKEVNDLNKDNKQLREVIDDRNTEVNQLKDKIKTWEKDNRQLSNLLLERINEVDSLKSRLIRREGYIAELERQITDLKQHRTPEPKPVDIPVRFIKVDDNNEPLPTPKMYATGNADTPGVPVMRQHSTGAVRSSDADDVRYDLVSPIAIRELAITYHEGSVKYSDNNWLKGFPASSLINHMERHMNLWKAGDRSDRHLAHAFWNLATLIHFEETRPELNDLVDAKGTPHYVPNG